MEIENIRLSELTPYKNNPRKNEKAVEGVANSIKEFGFKVPIVIDKDNVIVTGHTRFLAAQALGYEIVPCLRADDLTEDQIKAFRLADNKVAEISRWDTKKLAVELNNIKLDMRPFHFDVDIKPKTNERERTFDAYNLLEFDANNADGFFNMPIIRRTDFTIDKLIGFNYVLNTLPRKGVGVHFYIDDYQFERIWNSPEDYIPKLLKYDCCLTPDFSLYLDMPMAMKIWNVYRSRLIGQMIQNAGGIVIPTLSWAEPDTFKFCFDGLEPGGTYSVSTIGVKRSKEATKIWIDGMNEAMERLQPQTIICYGGEVDYSFTCDVIMVNNEVTTRMKRG